MRRYVYALAAATIMSVAMPVMAEETSTEEETSIEVDGTEESATGEDRASEIDSAVGKADCRAESRVKNVTWRRRNSRG